MLDDRFTPDRERARRDALIARLRLGTVGAPSWLLCPAAALRQEIEGAVAASGGGFFRVADWSVLALHLDHRLGLPFAAPIEETERALVVERALVAMATSKPALRDALSADPFGVSASLLGVIDLLRAHGWRGDAIALADPDDPVLALAASHVETLGSLLRALEAHLDAHSQLDLVGRLRRVALALRGASEAPISTLMVDGVEALDPTQRAVLQGLVMTGCSVEVAPWVERVGPSEELDEEAPTLLASLQTGASRASRAGDASVSCVRARDAFEEAEAIAQWIAEQATRGLDLARVAIRVDGSSGATDRVRRALARWGVASCGADRLAVRASPLWQVVRAGVRLAWRGVDAMDLATILAAPGAGVWGGDRDRLVAAVRRTSPSSWRGVREVLRDTFADDETSPDAGEAPAAVADPERAKRLADARVRVEELIDLFEQSGPFARHAPNDRRALLRGVVDGLISRFVLSERFAESIHEPRERTAWLLASQAIEGALRVEIRRIEERGLLLPTHDPSGFLTATESLLGEVEVDHMPPRDEGVAVLNGHTSPRRRPAVLFVTGFVRGSHPTPPRARLLLGARERALIDASLDAGAGLPTSDDDRAIAWRETLRLLALPTERVILFAPARGVDGAALEPSLTWTDLLARMSETDRNRLQRNGMSRAREWLDRELGSPLTARGVRLRAVAALGRGAIDEAVSLAAPVAARDAEARDFFSARFHPERAYSLGDLVRPRLAETVFSARDLEAAMTCRYRFLAESVLGLRRQRFARPSGVSPAERARVVRASLRRIDARLNEVGRVSDEEVDLAVEESLAQRVGTLTDEEELRRATRGFVLRYLSLREAWALRDGVDSADDEDPATFDLELLGGRVIKSRAFVPRVEALGSEAGATVVAIDFTLRSLDNSARLRDLGLDLEAALAPHAVATRHPRSQLSGYVRLSLAKPVGEGLAGRAAEIRDELIAPFETSSSPTAVRVEHNRRVEDHQDIALSMLSNTFDELDADDAVFAPHDEAEFERLRDGGAKTCDYCAARLACRFRVAGGA